MPEVSDSELAALRQWQAAGAAANADAPRIAELEAAHQAAIVAHENAVSAAFEALLAAHSSSPTDETAAALRAGVDHAQLPTFAAMWTSNDALGEARDAHRQKLHNVGVVPSHGGGATVIEAHHPVEGDARRDA